jgi:hypothetical protein
MGCGTSKDLVANTQMGNTCVLEHYSQDVWWHDEEVEVNGLPLQHYLESVCQLSAEDREMVSSRLQQELSQKDMQGHKSFGEASDLALCTRAQAQVVVFSWNVGGLSDSRQRRGVGLEEETSNKARQIVRNGLGQHAHKHADVIVIGLQEIISLTLDNVLGMGGNSSADKLKRAQTVEAGWPQTVQFWVDLLKETINDYDDASAGEDSDGSCGHAQHRHSYVLAGPPIYMFGLLLCVFCPSELCGTHLSDFESCEVAADRHASGAKGAVSCRFSLYDRSFCFVNVHLHADTSRSLEKKQQAFEERLQQLTQICEGINFRLQDHMVHPLRAHRAVFFLGDTNMRLVKPSKFKSLDLFQKHVCQCIEAGRADDLWQYDQLRQILAASSRNASAQEDTKASTSKAKTTKMAKVPNIHPI